MQGIDSSHPFIKKLQNNPQILQQLADFTILLQGKGLDTSSGKQPGFGQVSVVGARFIGVNNGVRL